MNREYYDKKSGLSKSIIEAEIDYGKALSNIKKLKENQSKLEYKITNELNEEKRQMFINIKQNIDDLLSCAINKQEELKKKQRRKGFDSHQIYDAIKEDIIKGSL